MIIFPAIDIRGGKCVRLEQGNADKETIYGEDPVRRAKLWESKGALFLHIVDLDGAFEGVRLNRNIIKSIVDNVSIPVQLGGGIRTIEDVDDVIELGISRVILGTSVVEVEGFIEEAIDKYGEKIAVSIDAKGGYIALNGWTKISDIKAIYFAKVLENLGLKTLIYTDISRDGMLQGPSIEELKALKESVNINIIASGGVSSAADVKLLKDLNIYGAIIGKALYTGNIKLEEILG
jgi:phosphoribosylformimino-5-aminoimidazole carboxamide ribotide isomerase